MIVDKLEVLRRSAHELSDAYVRRAYLFGDMMRELDPKRGDYAEFCLLREQYAAAGIVVAIAFAAHVVLIELIGLSPAELEQL